MKFYAAEEKIVEPLVVVYGTGKSKHMPKGKEFSTDKAMAELLVNKGVAVYEAPIESGEQVSAPGLAKPESKKEEKERQVNKQTKYDLAAIKQPPFPFVSLNI